MRTFIAFVLTKLFVLDVVCGYLLYKLMKQKRELDHYVELQLLNDSRVKQLEHANMENELSARRLERRLNIMELDPLQQCDIDEFGLLVDNWAALRHVMKG